LYLVKNVLDKKVDHYSLYNIAHLRRVMGAKLDEMRKNSLINWQTVKPQAPGSQIPPALQTAPRYVN
jgi:hypothetical protein